MVRVMENLRVNLFSESYASFTQLLEESNIQYKKNEWEKGRIVASSEWIEIVGIVAGGKAVGHVSQVIIEWLRSRSSRKAIIRTKDNESAQFNGYSASELDKILPKCKEISIFDTKKSERSK